MVVSLEIPDHGRTRSQNSQNTLDLVAGLLHVRLLLVGLQSRTGLVTERLPLRNERVVGSAMGAEDNERVIPNSHPCQTLLDTSCGWLRKGVWVCVWGLCECVEEIGSKRGSSTESSSSGYIAAGGEGMVLPSARTMTSVCQ
jgi:hypothetical protein